MNDFQNFEYHDYNVVYHPNKGGGLDESGEILMSLPAIWYEIYSPEGDKIGEANSAQAARDMIDRHIADKPSAPE